MYTIRRIGEFYTDQELVASDELLEFGEASAVLQTLPRGSFAATDVIQDLNTQESDDARLSTPKENSDALNRTPGQLTREEFYDIMNAKLGLSLKPS